MIDEIVEMILAETAKRPVKDRVSAIYSVMMDIDLEIIKVVVTARDIERGKKENENQG